MTKEQEADQVYEHIRCIEATIDYAGPKTKERKKELSHLRSRFNKLMVA